MMKQLKFIKIIILLFIYLFLNKVCYSQRYAFVEKTETYKSLDSISIRNFDYYNDSTYIPIGFNFQFYNQSFDSIMVYPYVRYYFRKDNRHGNDIGIIMQNPWNSKVGDIRYGVGGTVFFIFDDSLSYRYTTTGDEGERIFTIEWINNEYYLAQRWIHPTDPFLNYYEKYDSIIYYFNYQLKLYEKYNAIEMCYGLSYVPEGFGITMRLSDLQELAIYLTNEVSDVKSGFGTILNYTGLRGWPQNNTVYRFYADNNNKIFLNDYDLYGTIGEIIDNYGTLIGHNIYRDFEWGEKYYVSVPAIIKGVVFQNYGQVFTDDSAGVSIYKVGYDGLPDELVNTKKVPYKCLYLDGNPNYIAFDSIITIADSFFVSFNLNRYDSEFKDTIGLFYDKLLLNSTFEKKERYGRTAFRAYNNKWYDVYSTGYLSDKISNLVRDDDLIHFSLAPIINFNLDSTSLIADSLNCKDYNSISNEYVNYNGIKLFKNYPNPSDNYTIIKYYINQLSDIEIAIYSSGGKLMFLKTRKNLSPDIYLEYIKTDYFPDGIYFYYIKTKTLFLSSEFVQLKK